MTAGVENWPRCDSGGYLMTGPALYAEADPQLVAAGTRPTPSFSNRASPGCSSRATFATARSSDERSLESANASLARWTSTERVVDRSAHACFARAKHERYLGSAGRFVFVSMKKG
jgi:hypothetical protein